MEAFYLLLFTQTQKYTKVHAAIHAILQYYKHREPPQAG